MVFIDRDCCTGLRLVLQMLDSGESGAKDEDCPLIGAWGVGRGEEGERGYATRFSELKHEYIVDLEISSEAVEWSELILSVFSETVSFLLSLTFNDLSLLPAKSIK